MGLPRPIVFGNWKMHGLRADSRALAGGVWPSTPGDADRHAGRCSRRSRSWREVAAQLAGTGHRRRRPGLPPAGQGRLHRLDQRADAGGCRGDGGHRRPFRAPPRPGGDRCHGQGQGRGGAGRRPARRAVHRRDRGRMAAPGETLEVLDRQLPRSWPDGATADRLVVAYEPVWAVGTGRTPRWPTSPAATPPSGNDWTRWPRMPSEIAILYGGSVKAGQRRRDHGRARRGRRAGRRRQPWMPPASGPSIRQAGALDSGRAVPASVRVRLDSELSRSS